MLISSNEQLKKENELLKKEVVTSRGISTKPQMVKKISKKVFEKHRASKHHTTRSF